MPPDGIYPADLSNYYGQVILVIHEGKAHLELESYSSTDKQEVTAEFAVAWIKQFIEVSPTP